jgi:hypothetical protein
MQQNHPFSLYRKQDSCNTLIRSASDFPKSGSIFRNTGITIGQPLNRLNIATDRLLVLFVQTLQPHRAGSFTDSVR